MRDEVMNEDVAREDGSGLRFWRGLDELAPGADSSAALDEFADGASEWDDSLGRRRFLQLMGASAALAGLSGCLSGPPDPIVPYVDQPEQVVPGKPLFFATAVPIRGYAEPVLVESHTGRPTKIEGNPAHPASRGATSAQAQAALLDLYDPDRSQTVRFRGGIATWQQFVEAMQAQRARWAATGGAGLRLLTGPVTSPTLAAQLASLLQQFPAARWHVPDPAAPGPAVAVEPRYHFDRARVVLTLDAEVITGQPGSVRYARDLVSRRRVRKGQTAMSRIYAAESTPTLTGALADERLRLRPSEIGPFAEAVAARLGAGEWPAALSPKAQDWAVTVAADLRANRGAAVVVAGETLVPEWHVLVRRLNEALGAIGQTVDYGAPVAVQPPGNGTDLAALVREMTAGRVDTLVMLGVNPVYTAPADLPFAEALGRVETTVHLGSHLDETGFRSVWHVPAAHALETWSDARAYDGTVTLIQPLIAPLYDGRSAHEVLAVLTDGTPTPGYDLVRGFWQRELADRTDFDSFWRQTLRKGFLAGTAASASATTSAESSSVYGRSASSPPGRSMLRPYAGLQPLTSNSEPATLELILRPDPTIGTGEWANNGWLQETPKPLTKLTWDNAALISPSTAKTLGVENEDVVELRYRGQTVEAPVWVLAGQPEGCVTCHLGYGRARAGRAGTGAGFDAYRLRFVDAPWGGPGLEIRKTGKTYALAATNEQWRMHGRDLARSAPISAFIENPDFAHEGEMMELPTLYPGYEYDGYKWGMAIDLTACTGCNACVVACVAENNIPVVGKEEVRRGRHMYWLRIDRYYKGDASDPEEVLHQPVFCQHCENAPCELVCPVNATVHDSEGLNVMIYNRCMGTRYCSNNCPYKVRRFNFLQYTDYDRNDVSALRHNPDVTVRTRGVMEKCTYCVQRISHARIEAKKENRTIRDGEVVTACQGVCPTDAIVFGDMNDRASRVNQLKTEPHNYGLLAELGTRPRTTYLAQITNPNPALRTVQRSAPDEAS